MAKVAILTYHPIHIVENDYRGNDLIALENDLESLERRGVRVRSLDQIFTPPGSAQLIATDEPAVAITFDDGSVFDFVDHDHPTCGPQRSAGTRLREQSRRLRALSGAAPKATTFVIASPEVRTELDRVDYFAGGYWKDDWWKAAVDSGILAVESHSWDHNHPSIARSAQRDNVRGTFRNIETEAECEAEVAQSLQYIEQRAGVRPRFFAYPWGEASPYLAGEYLPTRGVQLGLWAAFSGVPQACGYATQASDRWLVPRFVCGHDWRSPRDFDALLDGLES